MTIADKPVRRETRSCVRVRRALRPLVIEIHATYISIRPKGMRHSFTVTMDQLYTLGAKNAAEQLRQTRAAARAARVPR